MLIQIVEANFALDAHAIGVLQLMNEYASDPMGGGAGLSEHAKANLVAELRNRPAVHVILAFDDDVPVGLLTCIEGFSTFACRPLLNIHDAIVSRSHRGRGLCKQMLEVAEAVARRIGSCKMTLEVLEGNEVAQAVYRSFGFAAYQLDPRMGRAMFWEKSLNAKSLGSK